MREIRCSIERRLSAPIDRFPHSLEVCDGDSAEVRFDVQILRPQQGELPLGSPLQEQAQHL